MSLSAGTIYAHFENMRRLSVRFMARETPFYCQHERVPCECWTRDVRTESIRIREHGYGGLCRKKTHSKKRLELVRAAGCMTPHNLYLLMLTLDVDVRVPSVKVDPTVKSNVSVQCNTRMTFTSQKLPVVITKLCIQSQCCWLRQFPKADAIDTGSSGLEW